MLVIIVFSAIIPLKVCEKSTDVANCTIDALTLILE